jgi:hypothetical protein
VRRIPERAFGEAAEIIDAFRFREDGVVVIRLLLMAEEHSLVTVFVTIMTDGVGAPGRPVEDAEDVEGILLLSDVVIPKTGVTGIISNTVGLVGLFDREADPAKLEDQAGLLAGDVRLAFCLNCSILSPGLIAKTMPAWQ